MPFATPILAREQRVDPGEQKGQGTLKGKAKSEVNLCLYTVLSFMQKTLKHTQNLLKQKNLAKLYYYYSYSYYHTHTQNQYTKTSCVYQKLTMSKPKRKLTKQFYFL